MAGRASLTTVPSRNTTPEPSTAATITHRPCVVPYRMKASPSPPMGRHHHRPAVPRWHSRGHVWGSGTGGAGTGGAGPVGPAPGDRHRRLGRADRRGAAPPGGGARRRRRDRRVGRRAVELVEPGPPGRPGTAPPRRHRVGPGAVGGGGRRPARRLVGRGGLGPAPAPGAGPDGRHPDCLTEVP